MNEDTIKGQFREWKGKIKAQWGRLTDDDMTQIEGNLEAAAGVLQKRYGIAKDEADRQWKEFRRAQEKTAEQG
jgi:uncharacterized protein YjbJ (UPF0337 family)